MDRIQINERLSVGKQHPNAVDLRKLVGEGFKSVVNLRTDGEPNQPLEPEEEGRGGRGLGMAYLHHSVASGEPTEANVDGFRRRLGEPPRPVFAHCASDKRSGAFLMMHVAAELGMSGEETVGKAAETGFACVTPEPESFVRSYVDQHRSAA